MDLALQEVLPAAEALLSNFGVTPAKFNRSWCLLLDRTKSKCTTVKCYRAHNELQRLAYDMKPRKWSRNIMDLSILESRTAEVIRRVSSRGGTG